MFVIDFAPHLTGKHYPVRNVRFSPDAGVLAATFGEEGDDEIAWWSLATSTLIASQSLLPRELPDPAVPCFATDLSFCAVHANVFVVAPFGDHVILLRPKLEWEFSRPLRFPLNTDRTIRSLACSQDGRWVLAAYVTGDAAGIGRWDLQAKGKGASGSQENNTISLGERDDPVALAISPDGTRIACGLQTGGIRLFDFRSRKLTAALESAPPDIGSSAIRKLVFSPDGTRLVVCRDWRLTVFDLARNVVEVQLEQTEFTDAAFCPNGKRVLTGGPDALVRFWDTTVWQEINYVDWNVGEIHSVTVSTDGAIAAAGGDKSRVVVWDLDV